MWYFWPSKIIFGEDALDFMENIAGKKCFIVTDDVLEKLGYVDILTEKLESLGREYEVYTGVHPDPHEEDVLEAREQCLDYGPDLIIALGGGSAMDVAKAVLALYEYPDYTIDDLHPFNPELYNLGKNTQLIAIPTTSGTGADNTYAIIISKKEEGIWKKLIHAHKGLVPSYTILDPVFPGGMPSELTVNTAFDALAHSMENFSNTWRNEFSDALGLKAIELIFEYLPKAYEDGDDMEARDMLHQAATIAGLAFGNSSVHIGHSLGHSWGSIFHTAHGEAVGILTPYVIQYLLNNPESDESKKIYAKLAKQLGWAKWSDSIDDAANSIIPNVKSLQKKVNLATKFADTGVSDDDMEKNLDKMVELTFQDPTITMAPRAISGEQTKRLFRYAFEGKDIDF
jgi:acetaldehyde dehydrogenase/alcohol dehydrogenase